jgi:deazaflavin-dependent oxidoreductase (nitroreductase family)
MSDFDLNQQVITEFRANGGRIGGYLEGTPVVLVRHRGRSSGREYVNPVVYLPDGDDPDTIYVFASNSGAPSNPGWYRNLVASGKGTAEVGTDAYPVSVHELTGAERDRIYEEQTRRDPLFAEFAQKTAGIRTIPVLALTRSQDLTVTGT